MPLAFRACVKAHHQSLDGSWLMETANVEEGRSFPLLMGCKTQLTCQQNFTLKGTAFEVALSPRKVGSYAPMKPCAM